MLLICTTPPLGGSCEVVNALISISKVILRWVRLLHGWLTDCRQVNHLGTVCKQTRGVRLAKNDFHSVFGSVLQKTAVFGSVSVLLN